MPFQSLTFPASALAPSRGKTYIINPTIAKLQPKVVSRHSRIPRPSIRPSLPFPIPPTPVSLCRLSVVLIRKAMSLTNASPEAAAIAAKKSSFALATLPVAARNAALDAVHDALAAARDDILAANARDLELARRAAADGSLSQALVSRLDLGRTGKWEDMLRGILDVRDLEDPLGRVIYAHRGSLFMLSKPIDGQAATGANGGTIGFAVESPEEAKAWHEAGTTHGGTAVEGNLRWEAGREAVR